MQILLAALTFFVAAVAIIAIFLAIQPAGQTKVVRHRLEAIEKAERRGHSGLELQLLRDEMMSNVPALHSALQHFGMSRTLRSFIGQAGMNTKPGVLILWSGILAFSLYLGVRGMTGLYMYGVPAGAVGSLIPLAYVAFRRMRRLHAFERNFPEAIDLLGRAVRAGHAFTTGIEMVGKELPEPVAGEFRTTFEEQNFGLPLKEALLNLAERVPLIDVRFFVIALLIQKESGGNLAEILDNLANLIRERFKILGEVRIRTAQGRMTAGILISLPPAMMGMLGAMNPGYIRLLFTDPWGPYMLIAAFSLQAIGSAMLWKIVHIEV